MKTIFSLLASAAIISGGTGITLSIPQHKQNNTKNPNFDPFNLSTWGDFQKKFIAQTILSGAQDFMASHKNAQWNQWVAEQSYSYYSEQDDYVLNGLEKFNNNIILDWHEAASKEFANVHYYVQNSRHQTIKADDTKTLQSYLNSGIYFVMKGYGDKRSRVVEIYGSTTVKVQAKTTFDKTNLSTWGAKQKAYIKQTILTGAKAYLAKNPNAQWTKWVNDWDHNYNYYILSGFNKFNPDIHNTAHIRNSGNLNYVTLNNAGNMAISKGDTRPLKDIFNNGVYLIAEGVRNPVSPFVPISGEITIYIKGNITKTI